MRNTGNPFALLTMNEPPDETAHFFFRNGDGEFFQVTDLVRDLYGFLNATLVDTGKRIHFHSSQLKTITEKKTKVQTKEIKL
jgi:hypothetical protein